MASLLLPHSIGTGRLLLRPCRPDDAAALTEAVAESRGQLDPWMPWSRYYDDPAAASVYIETSQASWKNGDELPLLITDRFSGEILGGTGFHHIHWDRGTFATGYWVRTSAIGQGIAREAVRALIKLVFEQFQGNRIWLTCDSRNDHSRQIPEALGFRREACCRNDSRATDGSLRDTLVYGMMVDEFPAAVRTWPAERFDFTSGQSFDPPAPISRYDDEEEIQSDPRLVAQFPNPRSIETPRLHLRVAELSDAPALFALIERSRTDFETWLPWARGIRTLADAEALCRKRMAQWARHGNTDLLAFDRETGQLTGCGMLLAFRPDVPSVELGWWLDAARTGKGLATEIGGALLRFAMEAWLVNRAEVWCQEGNHASRAVAARIGCIEEGIVRYDHPDADGHPANWAISSVIPDEFHDLKDRLPAIRIVVDQV
jgi:RimJ/RimL family protein N-acetyltransferase